MLRSVTKPAKNLDIVMPITYISVESEISQTHKQFMRKEVITAIFFGIIFGLLIAFGIYRANTAMKPASSNISQSKNDEDPETDPQINNPLTIAAPEENDVITDDTVTISGIAKPGSVIGVSSENDDHLTTADAGGEFKQAIELISGLNQIIITSKSQEGQISESILTLVHSTQLDTSSTTGGDEPEQSTDSAGTVRKRVQEKIQEVLTTNKAYLGSVTDIVEETFQITGEGGDISQISFGQDTTFANITDDQEEIDAEDVAIGDHVIAMGSVDEADVLNAKRVLVSEVPGEPVRKAYFTKIETLEERTLSFTINGQVVESVFPRRWKGPEINELSEGDNVFIVTTPEDGEMTIRTVLLTSDVSQEE